jgi:asparagine synthase (glutamine-hydrolysing)
MFRNSIEEVVYTQEEPFGSPSVFMQYFVMNKAKELGCKVMLDGQGGDETLLGYEKYYPAVYLDIYRKHGLLDVVKEIAQSHKNNSKMRLPWIIKYTIGSLFAELRKIAHKRASIFLKPYVNNFDFFNRLAKSYLDINELQKYEIYYTNLPILLRYEDRNSMRHSVETRLPFLDYKALEAGLSVNIRYKIADGWTKYILRKLAQNFLPEKIVWRKNKLGFNAPDEIWMDSIATTIKNEVQSSKVLDHLCDMKKLSKKFDKMDYRLKWRLYNIAVWERVYSVEID